MALVSNEDSSMLFKMMSLMHLVEGKEDCVPYLTWKNWKGETSTPFSFSPIYKDVDPTSKGGPFLTLSFPKDHIS